MTQSLIVIIIDLDLKEAEDLYVKCGNGDYCKINIARSIFGNVVTVQYEGTVTMSCRESAH